MCSVFLMIRDVQQYENLAQHLICNCKDTHTHTPQCIEESINCINIILYSLEKHAIRYHCDVSVNSIRWHLCEIELREKALTYGCQLLLDRIRSNVYVCQYCTKHLTDWLRYTQAFPSRRHTPAYGELPVVKGHFQHVLIIYLPRVMYTTTNCQYKLYWKGYRIQSTSEIHEQSWIFYKTTNLK